MSLTILALLAAPAAPQHCLFDNRVLVEGVVTTVHQAPAVPFDQIAAGDPLAMALAFATDVSCGPAIGQNGHLATPDCCGLVIGSASSFLDPAAAPCIWGESYVVPGFHYVEAVHADAPFAGGQVRAVLQIMDPQGQVGISVFDLTVNPVDVAAITAAGFSVSLVLEDAAGSPLAVVDVHDLSGSRGFMGFFGHYCTAVPNSTGSPASIAALGNPFLSSNDFSLQCHQLPPNSFGYFLVSPEQDFITGVPNSVGNLCLGGPIGRFIGPGQILNSGATGFVSLDVDLTMLPTPTGLINVQPGQTGNFTYWYRDATPTLTSNFSNGISVMFR